MTGQQVVKSALVQFENEPLDLQIRAGIKSAAQVREAVSEAAQAGGIIFFTLVSKPIRKAMKATAVEEGVEAVDVLGPVFSGLNSVFHRRARSRPGQYYKSEQTYFDRMDAIDYTLKHDDGQRIQELAQADIVLVGVSRSSKSSTCFFLAYNGIRAANVPLVLGQDPFKELTKLDPKRVIGLSVNSRRLASIRLARLHVMGVNQLDSYVDWSSIEPEIRHAHLQMSEHNWPCIDASYMAIEEIAKEVMRIMEEKGLRRRPRRPRSSRK